MKKCNFCFEEKEETDFPKKGAKCKSCVSAYKKEYAHKNKEIIKEKRKKYYNDNKETLSDKKREYYQNNKEEIIERVKEYYADNKEKIKEYKDTYNKNNYDVDYHKEYREKNKVSISEKRKEYYKKNKEEIKQKVSDYTSENREYVNKRKKNNRDKNKKYYNELNRKYIKNKKSNNPLFKLTCSIRSLISQSFKGQYTKKSKKTIEILGCTFDEFKIYIESQFTEEMNWNNYSIYWQLDHKIPISWAKDENEVYRLNHYTNFQPLYWKENISKGNRRSD
jgi:hypothetical protein